MKPAWHDGWRPERVAAPATIAAALLLLGLHQVVSGAVQQAGHRHASPVPDVAQVDAQVAVCEALHDAAQRTLCRLRAETAASTSMPAASR